MGIGVGTKLIFGVDASQPLVCVQVCLLAPLSAMILMCPPQDGNSSLSVLLNFDVMGSDWHDGVMWSSAVTVNKLA
jgi:hypothetical protein